LYILIDASPQTHLGDISIEGKSVLNRIWETSGWTQLAKYNFETWDSINPDISPQVAVNLNISISKKTLSRDLS
jgi:hypothetical protein